MSDINKIIKEEISTTSREVDAIKKDEAKKENEEKEAKKEKVTLWIFLNSKFGLFLLGSIILVFFMKRYSIWEAQSKTQLEISTRKAEILSEIKYRNISIDGFYDYINISIDDEEKLAQIPKIIDVFNGKGDILRDKFEEKKLVELYAEYSILDDTFLQGKGITVRTLFDIINFDFQGIANMEPNDKMKEIERVRKKYETIKGAFDNAVKNTIGI